MSADLHQKLADEAYDEWKKNDEMDYNSFIASLDQKHRLAVLTANLNYQVENGGFSQWHLNGYSSEAEQLIVLLSFYKDPTIKQVISLVQKAIGIINKYAGQINEAEQEQDFDDVDYYTGLMDDELDEIDDDYYVINDEFMKQIKIILVTIN